MSSDKKTIFLATIPAVLAGIKISGDGGGARLQLEIPESEMAHAMYLLTMRQIVFKVTIEPYDGFSNIHEDEK